MIRIIVHEADNRLMVSGAVETATVTHKTFDVELPEVEQWLRGAEQYVYRQFVGIEVRDSDPPRTESEK